MRRRSELPDIIGIAALDLFASSLGVFILLSFVLIPYFQRAPGDAAKLAAARATIARIEDDLQAAGARARIAKQDRTQAEEKLRQIRQKKPPAPAPKPSPVPATAQTVAKIDKGFYFPPLDVVFVLDTTRSMRQEIAEMRASMLALSRILNRLSPSVRVGVVAYRDQGEAYVTRRYKFTNLRSAAGFDGLRKFLASLRAKGGGDVPEDILSALVVAGGMSWRADAEQLIVVIADAPAHHKDWSRIIQSAGNFHRGKPPRRRISAVVTARHAENTSFFGRLSQAGGGEFVAHGGRFIDSALLSILQQR